MHKIKKIKNENEFVSFKNKIIKKLNKIQIFSLNIDVITMNKMTNYSSDIKNQIIILFNSNYGNYYLIYKTFILLYIDYFISIYKISIMELINQCIEIKDNFTKKKLEKLYKDLNKI